MSITEILRLHAMWLWGEEGGQNADLRWADLSKADLSKANLRWADLRWADLRWANLRGADLSKANLSKADLSKANLSKADLRGANLSKADLRGANLIKADLRWADLRGAIGIIHPPINDPRGYRCIAVWHDDQWRIAAGCRWFTVDEGRRHWGPGYVGDREIGDAYLAAVEWAAQQPGEGDVHAPAD